MDNLPKHFQFSRRRRIRSLLLKRDCYWVYKRQLITVSCIYFVTCKSLLRRGSTSRLTDP
jgi:hypothetical protein